MQAKFLNVESVLFKVHKNVYDNACIFKILFAVSFDIVFDILRLHCHGLKKGYTKF